MSFSELPPEFGSWVEFYEYVVDREKPENDYQILYHGSVWYTLSHLKVKAFDELYKELKNK